MTSVNPLLKYSVWTGDDHKSPKVPLVCVVTRRQTTWTVTGRRPESWHLGLQPKQVVVQVKKSLTRVFYQYVYIIYNHGLKIT